MDIDYKVLREELKEVVETVPRSNADMLKLYNETFPDKAVDVPEEVKTVVEGNFEPVEDEIWTYVGIGHEPPSVIKFMGRVAFTRGVATKVSDPVVLEKLKKGHKSFVKGEVNAEMIIRQDENEAEKYEQKVRHNQIVQLEAARNNR